MNSCPRTVPSRLRSSARRTAISGAIALLLTASLAGCSLFPMSKEDAGAQYLSIVCPSNVAADALNAAYDTKDLGTVQGAARAMAEAEQESAKRLSDDSTAWPGEVSREDLDTLADSYLSDLAILNTIFQADSLDEARVFWPNDPEVGEASQRVRLALGLSSDTSVSCE